MLKTDSLSGSSDTSAIDGAYTNAAVNDASVNVVATPGPINIITGTSGSETLLGTGGIDIIFGLGGNDYLDGGAGADTLVGGDGNDTYVVDNPGDVVVEDAGAGTDVVNSSVTYALPENVEILNLTGTSSINGTANDSGATLNGNSGNNVLTGGAGADTLIGGGGADTLIGGAGNDNLTVTGSGSSFLYGGTGSDILNASGSTGNILLDGGAGADQLIGGAGNDTFVVDNTGDTITEVASHGTDTVQSSIDFTLAGTNLENLTLTGTAAVNGTGSTGDNILTGNEADNTLTGNGGNDALYGGGGNDTLVGGSGNDILDGGTGNDSLSGGGGNDTYYVNSAGDTVTEAPSGGTDLVYSTAPFFTLSANVENLTLLGTAFGGTGNSGDNIIIGNAGVNLLVGGAGNDYLDGGAGVDTLQGGTGNDTYVVDNIQDVVTDVSNSASGGIDLVKSSITYSLTPALTITDPPAPTTADIENLTLIGSANINGTGNTLGNVLTGNAGNNTLDGGAGNDTLYGAGGIDVLIGGDGSDTYLIDSTSSNVTISETGASGTDLVQSSITWDLSAAGKGAGVENLTLLDVGGNINGTGNSLDNVITGNSGNNVLNGGSAGNDTLIGGSGNDTYVVNSSTVTITETGIAATGGIDVVQSSLTWDLSAAGKGANVENLTLTGAGSNINGTGNGLNNIIIGTNAASGGVGGNNVLTGGAGADYLIGGTGDDTYFVDDNSTTATLLVNGVPITITGDTILEAASGGTDLVHSSVSYTLSANVENLTLDTGALNGTGNLLANIILGNAAANTLNDGGVGGSDSLNGGDGNDTYIVNNTGDTITEVPTGGTDQVISSVNWTLGANVENLTLVAGSLAVNGTGNALANIIIGNANSNVLDDGGPGAADTLVGGLGNDTYNVNNSTDTITESAAASFGVDTVVSSVDYSLLAHAANVENLTLKAGSAAIGGTGNTLANVIIGNANANLLDDGGAGAADSLSGGLGNDTYNVNNTGDTITEVSTGGTDQVVSSVNYSLLAQAANVENLTLLAGSGALNATGNTLANIIIGNANANTLNDGGTNAAGVVTFDSLAGGDGNDTYFVNNTGDTITEVSTGGVDLVSSSVNYVLPVNVETLTLTGTAVSATGNSTNGGNLNGNVGNNILTDGGVAGVSTGPIYVLAGGSGNDTYIVNNSADTISETASGGVDTVKSSFSFTLTPSLNLENLTLTGTGNFTATGNTGVNILVGNSGNNILDDGGIGGADSLSGGDGNDTYNVHNATDTITETSTGGTDQVISSVTYTLSTNVENLTLTGANGSSTSTDALNGTGNASDNTIIGNAGNNILSGGSGNDTLTGNAGSDYLDGGTGADTLTGGTGNDTYVVDNITTVVGGLTGDQVVESAGQGTDLVLSSVTYTLPSNVENLTLTATGLSGLGLNINGTGNTLNNIIIGNAGDNQLDGGTGADYLAGGAGNDTYFVDNNSTTASVLVNGVNTTITGDTISEASAAGTDQVISAVNFTLPANVENLTLLAGSAAISATGNTLSNTIVGNANDNVLNDGGVGGSDSLSGGLGNDTYFVNNTGDTITDAGGNTDLVSSTVSWDLSATGKGTNIHLLTLTGAANVNGTANNLGDTLIGNDGNNTLTGGTGNDKLQGGLGVDTLVGGTGNDTFVFTSATDTGLNSGNRDKISDFVSGTDKVDISQLVDNTGTGEQGAWWFMSSTGSFDGQHAGEVIFTAATGSTPGLLQFDQNGDGTADFQIELTGVSTFVLGDFFGSLVTAH